MNPFWDDHFPEGTSFHFLASLCVPHSMLASLSYQCAIVACDESKILCDIENMYFHQICIYVILQKV